MKRPSLLAYANDNLDTQIAREVDVCEILRQNPHPNIAIYYGYEESHGRVAGVCYRRYTSTLLEAVNLGRLDKRRFASSGLELVTDKTISSLERVLDGIQHLHSLGIVHNDINPANIMFDKTAPLFLLILIAAAILGRLLAVPRRKEPTSGMILLLMSRWKTTISTPSKSCEFG
jgi:serine/threonine protein kinase